MKSSRDSIISFLPSLAVSRPITIIMFFMILFIWGIISYFKIPVELKPNTSFNHISIIVNIRGGMSPVQVEKLITTPIEEMMSSITNLKTIESTSKEGKSSIVLSFPAGTDMDLKSLEISERYERIKNNLPHEANRPVIAKYEQNDIPVMMIAVNSDTNKLEEIRETVEFLIKPELMKLTGIANVEISGGRERKIVIEVKEEQLLSRNLSLDQIANVIGRNNLNALAGNLQKGKYSFLVRTKALYQNLDDIRDTILQSNGIEDVIFLKDVATVSYQYMDTDNISRINASPVISLYIQKESAANTIKVCQKIKNSVMILRKQIPDTMKLQIIDDQSLYIKEVIEKVKTGLIWGALLATIVLFVFLQDLFATIIVAVSIPLCVIITLSLMYWQNISLNIMSLSGLALGIGMLVDNSIVVLENISKHKIKPCKLKAIIIKSTSELIMPLIASTLSTIIVFLPIIFVNPQTKMLYGSMALTVSFSLISSLFVSITLAPALFSLRNNTILPKKIFFFEGAVKRYQTILTSSLRNRYFILSIISILLLASYLHFTLMEKDMAGGTNDGRFIIFVELQSGAKVEISDKVVSKVEKTLAKSPQISSYSSRIDGWSSKIYVQCKSEYKKQVKQIITTLKPQLEEISNNSRAFIYTNLGKNSFNAEVVLNIFGYKYDTLLELSSKIFEQIKSLGGFVDCKLRYKQGRPEKIIRIKKQNAFMLGFSVKEISDALHARVRGIRATKVFEDGKEIETIIKLQKENRKTLKEVLALQLVNKAGKKVKLSELAEFKDNIAPSEIWHKDKRRMIQLSSQTSNYPLLQAIEVISKRLKNKLVVPENYYIQFAGNYKEMIKTLRYLQYAFFIMLILVYMLLASLFESYIQPLIIMLSVPFAMIGVSLLIGLSWNKVTIGVLMGLIMLGGIVVNNAIVLVDSYNKNKLKNNHNTKKNIILASKSRLRPIIMTTITTIAGLLPLAVDSSSSASLWSPLAITVIGGLISSTFLTLIIIPAMILIVKDIKGFLRIFYKKG